MCIFAAAPAAAAALPAWSPFGTAVLSSAGSSIFTASNILTGLSTAFGAFSSIQQGRAAAASAKYQSAIAERNAALAEQNARDVMALGEEQANQQRAKARALTGTQRAAFAASNIDLSSESAIDTMADTAFMGELDAQTILSNASREAYGYRMQRDNYRLEGAAQRNVARSSRRQGFMSAAGTLLGGASTISDRWTRQRQGLL